MPGDVGFLFPPKAKMRIPSLKVGIMASIYIKTLNKQIQMELSVNKVFVKKKWSAYNIPDLNNNGTQRNR